MNHTVIEAGQKNKGFGLLELFRYKDLLITLSWRDFRVRYAQTAIGIVWAFLQPAVTLFIFTFVFGRGLKVNTNSIPYPLFAMSGMCAWTYFAFVMSQSGTSIIGAQAMVKKIYFPRLVIPVAKAVVGLIDLAITFLMLILLFLYYRYPVSATIIYLPLFVFYNIIVALGVGIWLSALSIRYRDFQHIIPFMVQIGLYANPVAYPASYLGGKLAIINYINPLSGIIEGFRWCFFGTDIHWNMILSSGVISLVLFFSGLYYFKSIESKMADFV